jgi:hypothetical protein
VKPEESPIFDEDAALKAAYQAGIRFRSIEGDEHAYCPTHEAFVAWLKAMGWKDEEGWFEDTGVTWADDLKGQWFLVVHNRVFTVPYKGKKRG